MEVCILFLNYQFSDRSLFSIHLCLAETRLDELLKSLQKGDSDSLRTNGQSTRDGLQTFKSTQPASSSAAATVASHLLMSDNSSMIPNNQSALMSSNNLSGGRSGPPPLPDNYKNNILKAKTFDENKIAEATNVGINQSSFANDRFHRYVIK